MYRGKESLLPPGRQFPKSLSRWSMGWFSRDSLLFPRWIQPLPKRTWFPPVRIWGTGFPEKAPGLQNSDSNCFSLKIWRTGGTGTLCPRRVRRCLPPGYGPGRSRSSPPLSTSGAWGRTSSCCGSSLWKFCGKITTLPRNKNPPFYITSDPPPWKACPAPPSRPFARTAKGWIWWLPRSSSGLVWLPPAFGACHGSWETEKVFGGKFFGFFCCLYLL